VIEKLGHYKIVSELGRGGMGVVYKAYEESLNRFVAIKVLGEHLGHDENFVKRFVREAKAVAALSHPNVIQIFYIGHEAAPGPNPQGPDARHYFVMEFVEGRSVHDLLMQEGALDPQRAARIALQAASGLAVAHDQGLVHRDIKPANLLVTKNDRVKIADFGLALSPTDGATRLTATNSLMGTPGYLSPEQCCGEPAGPRSDIYSLGMTFYEMLTGSMPFKGESPLAVLRQILDEEPPPLLQVDPHLDPRIAKVVERMVAKEPNDRYQSCHEVVADLSEILGAGGTAALPAAGVVRSTALPPLPPSPPATSARTQAKVTGRGEDAPTQAAPSPSRQTGRTAGAGVAATAAAAAAVAPPPPAPAGATAAPLPAAAAPAAVQPVIAANAGARSSKGGRWILIGAMAVMLVIAVSAAGFFLAVPMIKDAPFLRDVPFLRDASFMKGAADSDVVATGSTVTDTDAASGPVRVADRDRGAGTFAIERPEENEAAAAAQEGRESKSSSASSAAPSAANSARTSSSSPSAEGVTRSLAASPGRSEASDQIAERGPAQEPPAPPRRAPMRANPRVSVVAVGEPMFAGAAEEALEAQLARHGVDLYDERGVIALRDGGGASQIAPSSLLGMVAERGVDVLILIDVEPMGQRELNALGRYSYATTARVRVDAYLAADGDAIGRGWSQQVEYAEPNATSKADGAMGNFSTEIAEAIEGAWQDLRSGAR
jgi:serine/threonine-protein kinase